jgi:sulfite dehydrogenase
MATAYRTPATPGRAIEPGTAPKKTDPIARFTIRSFITSVPEKSTLPLGRERVVRGIAFDAGHGIREVAFSSDGGRSWRAAELGKDIGKYSFREWTIAFTPRERGARTLMSRAVNRLGETQPMEPLWNPAGYLRNVVEPVQIEVA